MLDSCNIHPIFHLMLVKLFRVFVKQFLSSILSVLISRIFTNPEMNIRCTTSVTSISRLISFSTSLNFMGSNSFFVAPWKTLEISTISLLSTSPGSQRMRRSLPRVLMIHEFENLVPMNVFTMLGLMTDWNRSSKSLRF